MSNPNSKGQLISIYSSGVFNLFIVLNSIFFRSFFGKIEDTINVLLKLIRLQVFKLLVFPKTWHLKYRNNVKKFQIVFSLMSNNYGCNLRSIQFVCKDHGIYFLAWTLPFWNLKILISWSIWCFPKSCNYLSKSNCKQFTGSDEFGTLENQAYSSR